MGFHVRVQSESKVVCGFELVDAISGGGCLGVCCMAADGVGHWPNEVWLQGW